MDKDTEAKLWLQRWSATSANIALARGECLCIAIANIGLRATQRIGSRSLVIASYPSDSILLAAVECAGLVMLGARRLVPRGSHVAVAEDFRRKIL